MAVSKRGSKALCRVAVAVALGGAPSAGAQPAEDQPAGPSPGLALTWRAPPECPDADALRAAIAELVGRAPGDPIATEIEVRGTVLESSQGYQVWLSWRTPETDEQRLLEAASCAELARASALVVAFAIGTDVGGAEPTTGAPPATAAPGDAGAPPGGGAAAPPSENPEPGSARPPAAPANTPPNPARSEEIVIADLELPRGLASSAPTQPGIRVEMRVQLAVDVGSLAAPSPGVLAGLQVQGGPWIHGFEAGISLPQRITDSGRSGRFFWGLLAFRTCHAYPGKVISASPCLVAELHVLRGKGEDLAKAEERYAWIPRAGIGLELRRSISPRVTLVASGYQMLAPWRPSFVVGEAVVFEPSLLSARLSGGVELRLP